MLFLTEVGIVVRCRSRFVCLVRDGAVVPDLRGEYRVVERVAVDRSAPVVRARHTDQDVTVLLQNNTLTRQIWTIDCAALLKYTLRTAVLQ